jgi:hypothetical protein
MTMKIAIHGRRLVIRIVVLIAWVSEYGWGSWRAYRQRRHEQ